LTRPSRSGSERRMLEQQHLLTIADQRIEAIDELCTGFFTP
jgi:hypothetical protein